MSRSAPTPVDPTQTYALFGAVGIDATTAPPETWNRSFLDLGIDSLGRMEIASRIQARWGVDIEDEIDETTEPRQLAHLVERALAPGSDT